MRIIPPGLSLLVPNDRPRKPDAVRIGQRWLSPLQAIYIVAAIRSGFATLHHHQFSPTTRVSCRRMLTIPAWIYIGGER